MDVLARIALFGQTAVILALIILLLSVPSALLRIRLARNRRLFKCIQCGTCCRIRTIPLKEKDVKRIEENGAKDFWESRSREKVMKRSGGRCIFLKDDKCSIHDFKPEICRKFPFFSIYRIPYCRLWMSCPGVEQLKKDVEHKRRGD